MKLHCLYYSLLFLFPVLCACADSGVDSDFQISLENREVEKPSTLTVDKQSIELPSADAKDYLQITTEGTWTIFETFISDWLTISPMSGVGSQRVSISATENKTTEERIEVIGIRIGADGIDVSIKQQGKYLRLSQQQVSFNSNGGSVDIQIETDGVLYIQNDNDWITCEPSQSHLKISATANTVYTNRQAEVYLSPVPIDDISKCQVITVKQTGLGIGINVDDYAQDENWNDKN